MQSFIAKQLQDHLALFQKMEAELTAPVAELAERLIETFKIGNKLLIMGNGGSAADAQHLPERLSVVSGLNGPVCRL
jgi:phosphoheptose isomerase (EC 5.3.1.-)